MASAIFLGAFLLFQVEPLIGKFVLPWFGGAPAVWTTCLLFFQTLLLAGYAYAHVSVRYLSPKAQGILHLVVLAGAVCLLPIIPSGSWKPSGSENPTLRILLLLTACVGLPYFALAATGPLIQAWAARGWRGESPYRLYALSNIASFLALLSYPVLVEPLLTRRGQAWIWSGGMIVFALICGYCAVEMRKRNAGDLAIDARQNPTEEPEGNFILWLMLPACGSLLLLAVTNTICQEIAVIPLLWIVPLALYLLSFVICFDNPKWYDRRVWMVMMLVALGAVCWAGFPGHEDLPMGLRLGAYLLALFGCCMVCHGELYRLRPGARQLTHFYLCIAAGGAAGGFFVAIVAPVLFSNYSELQAGLMLAYVLMLVMLWRDPRSLVRRGRFPLVWIGAISAGAMLGLLLWAMASAHLGSGKMLWRSRNFYGVLTVYQQHTDGEEIRLLHHGGITHGLQFEDARIRDEPTTYYGRRSGVGLAFASLPSGAHWRVGAIGLGTGTVAVYARPGDVFRFYEINPMVIDLASRYFTFLSDSAAKIEMVTGDARLSLEREAAQRFDLLIVDAFSGDAIPVHLLTSQCMEVYLRHLAAGGIIAIHTSNLHLDLEPVVRALAKNAGLAVVKVQRNADDPFHYDSQWMLLSRDEAVLNREPIRSGVSPVELRSNVPLWTDDYSDLFRILR